jgi:hypothetical protein
MKVLIIDPHLRTVTEAEHDGGLEVIYKLLHCERIEATAPNKLHLHGDFLYVDEEGLLGDLSKQAFFYIEGQYQPLAGYGMVLGTTKYGDNAPALSTVEDVLKVITWMNIDDVRRSLE